MLRVDGSKYDEYLATADPSKIDLLLSVFDEPASEKNREVQLAVRQLLLDAAPLHADVFSAIPQSRLLAEGDRLAAVQELSRELDTQYGLPVRNLVTHAVNLSHERKFAEAHRQLDQALTIFPDSARAQSARAQVAEAEGNLESAQVALRRAVAIYPDASDYHYALGRVCFLRRDYAASADAYAKAVELGFDDPAIWHAIARTHQEQGARDKAISCFKRYLELEPHGPNEQLVRGYLASVGAPVEPDPTNLLTMLLREDYQALEEALDAILQRKQQDKQGRSEIDAAYDYLCSNPWERFEFEPFLGRFKRWAAARPESHAAHAAYGAVLLDHAWHRRGGGWAVTVTSEGGRLFEERLRHAQRELEQAHALNPSNPIVAANLIKAAKGLGLEEQEMED